MAGAKLLASCGGNKEFTLFAMSVRTNIQISCLSPFLYKLAKLRQKKNTFSFYSIFLFLWGEDAPQAVWSQTALLESFRGSWVNRRPKEKNRNGCDARAIQFCPSHFWAQTEQQLVGVCQCLWSHRIAYAIYSQSPKILQHLLPCRKLPPSMFVLSSKALTCKLKLLKEKWHILSWCLLIQSV